MERRLRLRQASEVQRVYEQGAAWTHPLLVLLARPNGLALTRVAVAAARSIGKAVARNRAKRLLREAARHLHPRIQCGWDLVLIARRPIVEVKEPQVEQALAHLLERAHLLRPSGAEETEPA